jgi:hypothetical protein
MISIVCMTFSLCHMPIQEFLDGLASYGYFLDQGPQEYRDDVKGTATFYLLTQFLWLASRALN